MEKVYWLKFYEDGVFCSVIGSPHGVKAEAQLCMVSLVGKFQQQGFQVRIVDADTMTYDRNGTLCTLKIEEE